MNIAAGDKKVAVLLAKPKAVPTAIMHSELCLAVRLCTTFMWAGTSAGRDMCGTIPALSAISSKNRVKTLRRLPKF
jgi:hypothetical protein